MAKQDKDVQQDERQLAVKKNRIILNMLKKYKDVLDPKAKKLREDLKHSAIADLMEVVGEEAEDLFYTLTRRKEIKRKAGLKTWKTDIVLQFEKFFPIDNADPTLQENKLILTSQYIEFANRNSWDVSATMSPKMLKVRDVILWLGLEKPNNPSIPNLVGMGSIKNLNTWSVDDLMEKEVNAVMHYLKAS